MAARQSCDGQWWRRFYIQTGVSQQFDDWHPDVFQKFDPEAWVDTIASTGADSCHIQSKCHSGNAYYVSPLDHLHLGYRGRDGFGAVVDGLHARGVKVLANKSILYDNLQYREHPDWRIRYADGRDSKGDGAGGNRAGVVCFNSPYRDLARAQLEAFARAYRPDVLFLDMMFIWISVCHCRWCRERYHRDTGRELPGPDDRTSPEFHRYIRWRNQCLYEFTEMLVKAFKAIHPDVPVTVNSPKPHTLGPISILKMVNLVDFVCGDPTPTDPSPASVIYSARAWANMKPDRIARLDIGRFHGFEMQHVGMRSLDEMTVSALVCAVNDSAIQLFDICNGDGTLYRSSFAAFREVFSRVRPVEPLLGGQRIRTVGVYLSEDTSHYHQESGAPGAAPEYLSGMRETFRAFHDPHVPVDVITKLNLAQLDQYALVCLPDALCLTAEEVAGIREYVRAGGRLLATRFSSLANEDGERAQNFALADVFGADCLGVTENNETYLAVDPQLCREAHLAEDQEVKVDAQAIVRAREGTQVLARMVLPYSNRRNDRDRWFAIWTSPPGMKTEHPCIVMHDFGKGGCCYVSGRLNSQDALHSVEEPRRLIYALGRRLLGPSDPLSVEAPPWITVSGYRQPERRRIVVHLVNCQRDLPIMPVPRIAVSVRLAEHETVESVTAEPDTLSIPFTEESGMVRAEMPALALHRAMVVHTR